MSGIELRKKRSSLLNFAKAHWEAWRWGNSELILLPDFERVGLQFARFRTSSDKLIENAFGVDSVDFL